ncbi:acylphosphatase [Magnetovibrio blakemorei]|uniref:Acylphosphatase n=1 Tax=Magnetovibrio blakemorei TaxID=28181 RepID=A0A1E5QA36_9PROT|nr:acylphosphatase [Magnetovibrio blakemorei]OEJ68604.1 acylphosphatase [Magnetovibrio blakemorei]
MKSVHVIISGRVQGVWFRAWTQKKAMALGLTGWVKNRPDGKVEALFSGPTDQVETMLKNCQKGPPLARVDSIEQSPADAPESSEFSLLRPD